MAVSRYQKISAVVLKRIDYSEADRIVTVFSKERGKLALMAKGVRRAKAKNAASIEIGTWFSGEYINSNSLPILTQSVINNSFSTLKNDLTGCTQLFQIVEIVDILTREEQELPEVFEWLVECLSSLPGTSNKRQFMFLKFKELIETLGFADNNINAEIDVKNLIEMVADKKIKSKDFLSI